MNGLKKFGRFFPCDELYVEPGGSAFPLLSPLQSLNSPRSQEACVKFCVAILVWHIIHIHYNIHGLAIIIINLCNHHGPENLGMAIAILSATLGPARAATNVVELLFCRPLIMFKSRINHHHHH